jgi:hypothetical protein
MNERTIQIDVIGKIEGTQFMKCKLYTNCSGLSLPM